MIDDDFDSIASTMTDGIDTAKQGLQIIDQVQTALPEIQQLGDQATDFASATKEGAQQVQDALPSISNSVQVTIEAVRQVASSTASWSEALNEALDEEQLANDRESILKTIDGFQQSIQQQQSMLDSLITFLNRIEGSTENTQIQNIITHLNEVKIKLTNLSDLLARARKAVQDGDIKGVKQYLSEITGAAKEIDGLLGSIDVPSITDTIEKILSDLITTITTAQDVLKKAQSH